MPLPEGFVLDQPQQKSTLPPGFVLDSEPSNQGGVTVTPLIGKPFEADPSKGAFPKLENMASKALELPSQMSRKGLGMVSGSDTLRPNLSGNLATDVMRGTPQVLAETARDVAPDFISKEAIAGGGLMRAAPDVIRAVKPILKPIGKVAGKTAKQIGRVLTGVEPEYADKLYEKPSRLFAKTKESASKFYQEMARKAGIKMKPATIKEALASERSLAKDVFSELENGPISAGRALEGRQAIDDILSKGKKPERIKTALYELRKVLDDIVKESPDLAKADEVFSDSAIGGKFRSLIPLNKGGSSSVLRGGVGGAATLAGFSNPLAFLLPAAMAPATYGTAIAGTSGLARGAKGAARILAKSPGRAGAIIGSRMNKDLTDKEAEEYLRKAEGDPSLARRLALQDGRRIPD